MARHASDRGARSPHIGRRRARGGDTRRRAAPLSNPHPTQPSRPIIWPVACMYELEPQPPAGGQRALARTSLLLAAVLQVRRAARHGRNAAEPRASVVAQLLALRDKRRPAAA